MAVFRYRMHSGVLMRCIFKDHAVILENGIIKRMADGECYTIINYAKTTTLVVVDVNGEYRIRPKQFRLPVFDMDMLKTIYRTFELCGYNNFNTDNVFRKSNVDTFTLQGKQLRCYYYEPHGMTRGPADRYVMTYYPVPRFVYYADVFGSHRYTNDGNIQFESYEDGYIEDTYSVKIVYKPVPDTVFWDFHNPIPKSICVGKLHGDSGYHRYRDLYAAATAEWRAQL
jgi:hypothetical protein